MQIIIDEKGYVASYAIIGQFVGGIEVSDPVDEDWFAEHFEEFKYNPATGELIRDVSREAALANQRFAEELRVRREKECFSVINRGEMWYSLLTDAQKAELKEWYKAWLDVTETLEPPDKLDWI